MQIFKKRINWKIIIYICLGIWIPFFIITLFNRSYFLIFSIYNLLTIIFLLSKYMFLIMKSKCKTKKDIIFFWTITCIFLIIWIPIFYLTLSNLSFFIIFAIFNLLTIIFILLEYLVYTVGITYSDISKKS